LSIANAKKVSKNEMEFSLHKKMRILHAFYLPLGQKYGTIMGMTA
jgi:hypothetical protein